MYLFFFIKNFTNHQNISFPFSYSPPTPPNGLYWGIELNGNNGSLRLFTESETANIPLSQRILTAQATASILSHTNQSVATLQGYQTHATQQRKATTQGRRLIEQSRLADEMRIFPGTPHNDYSNLKIRGKLEKIIMVLMSISEYGLLTTLAEQTNIPRQTLSHWKQSVIRNPLWRPWCRTRKLTYFTPEEEKMMADYIKVNYIDKKKIFTNQDFKAYAITVYAQIHCNDENYESLTFKCSNKFIRQFKMRHGFSSRKSHFKRRPIVDPNSPYILKFIQEIDQLLSIDKPNYHVLNMDETNFLTIPNGLTTWAEKGTDAVIAEYQAGNDKQAMTVLATIDSEGNKYPLLYVAKGKTNRVEKTQIGNVEGHYKCHSKSGWSTNEVMRRYIDFIVYYFQTVKYEDNPEIHIVLDVYASHHSDETKQYAADKGVFLHYIPAGCTDLFQPLDRVIFAIVKARARYYFRLRFQNSANMKFGIKEASEDFAMAWNMITEKDVMKAWAHFRLERNNEIVDENDPEAHGTAMGWINNENQLSDENENNNADDNDIEEENDNADDNDIEEEEEHVDELFDVLLNTIVEELRNK